MKKELKITAVVLAAIIVFLAGFGLGTSKGIQINVDVKGNQSAANSSATPANNNATPAPTPTPSQEQTTAAPAPSADASKPADESKPADGNSGSPSAIPQTPKEVTAKYNEVVNNLKKAQNVSVHKVGTVDIQCTDCSISFAKSAVDSVLKNFITNTDETIQFANGEGQNSKGETKTLNQYIPPFERDAAVTENDVVTATAAAEGSGYKMTLVFKSEKSTYDGTTTVNPTSHMTAMDPLNLATISIPGGSITNADMTYPGATCDVTVDGSGNVTKLHLNLPLEGTGTGKILAFSPSVGLKGVLDDTFEMTY